MANEATGSGDEKPLLNEREQKLMAAAFTCLKSPPEIDYEKLAPLVGMTNPRSASNAFGVIKKKLWPEGLPSAAAAKGDTPKRGRKPANKKEKAAEETNGVDSGDNGDGDNVATAEEPVTPKAKAAPRKRKTPAKKEKDAASDEADADANGDDAIPEESPKKKPRKTKPKANAAIKKEDQAEQDEPAKENENDAAEGEKSGEDAAEDEDKKPVVDGEVEA